MRLGRCDMSMSADFLNTLSECEREKITSMMKEGQLILCDSVVEVMAAITQLATKRRYDA